MVGFGTWEWFLIMAAAIAVLWGGIVILVQVGALDGGIRSVKQLITDRLSQISAQVGDMKTGFGETDRSFELMENEFTKLTMKIEKMEKSIEEMQKQVTLLVRAVREVNSDLPQ